MKSLLIFSCALFFFSWQLVGAGLILVSQEEIDFGSYPSWEARQGTFLLRNTGNSDVVLKRVRSTCGCLVGFHGRCRESTFYKSIVKLWDGCESSM